MRLYLINPSNPLVSIVNVKESRWNRYRVWKPLAFWFWLPLLHRMQELLTGRTRSFPSASCDEWLVRRRRIRG